VLLAKRPQAALGTARQLGSSPAVLCLEVERIKETPREFRLEGDRLWWEQAREALQEPEIELGRPFMFSFQAHRIGMRLLFRGEVDGVANLVCGRCLEPYGYEFREPVQLLLEPAPTGTVLPEGGLDLDPEDLEIGRYGGDVLDFDLLLREVLALAWPVQPRCDEGCQGLCPVCGRNRNLETCACSDPSVSRPFARLGELIEEAATGDPERRKR
jgi:uncharacterized protein